LTYETSIGDRKHAQCPDCNSLERHRLQKLVFDVLLADLNLAELSVLHIAPENCMKFIFKDADKYVTADLSMKDVDYNFDLTTAAPFPNEEFHVVFASHVLEHIKDDRKALEEIRRILKPGGFAVLPVPLVVSKTIEYPEPNAYEDYHVRAPGFDYFERFHEHFNRVVQYSSESFPAKHQLYIYEDRSQYPTERSPLRTPSLGERHVDVAPVCIV